jgi:hypothetical protein
MVFTLTIICFADAYQQDFSPKGSGVGFPLRYSSTPALKVERAKLIVLGFGGSLPLVVLNYWDNNAALRCCVC